MTTEQKTIDEQRLEEFVNRAVGDVAAAETAAVAYLGDRLGLYRALAGAGPLTTAELAGRTGTAQRYVREWLGNQVASGYISYDPDEQTYELPAEHAQVLADEGSAVFMGGAFEILAAVWAATDPIAAAFRSGEGVGWHEHDPRLFRGVERLFTPIYRSQLTTEWIPALDGVEAELEAGARVADVGCGHGASTIVMAERYPRSTFVGFDYHDASITAARKAAADAGVTDRVDFEVASSTAFGGDRYDLVCFFDCLHDMGDPVAAAAHARQQLTADGTLMVVEPRAADRLEDNRNPVSQLYYAGSVFLCTPSSLSQEGAVGLGAQAGPARLQKVLRDAGFRGVRVATETPFNLVLEARP